LGAKKEEAAPSGQQQTQFHPAPANGLALGIVGVQRRKKPRLPASHQSLWNKQRDLPGAARWMHPPVPEVPGLEAGSRLIRCPHPLALRFPTRPPAMLHSDPPRHSTLLPHSLAPPRCNLWSSSGEKVAPTAASAPALSTNRLGPLPSCWAWKPYPLPPHTPYSTHTHAPKGPQSPSLGLWRSS
jgi:hypothetical protein